MNDETSRTPRNSKLGEKLRNLVTEVAASEDLNESDRPVVWSNAEEMFASEFA